MQSSVNVARKFFSECLRELEKNLVLNKQPKGDRKAINLHCDDNIRSGFDLDQKEIAPSHHWSAFDAKNCRHVHISRSYPLGTKFGSQ